MAEMGDPQQCFASIDWLGRNPAGNMQATLKTRHKRNPAQRKPHKAAHHLRIGAASTGLRDRPIAQCDCWPTSGCILRAEQLPISRSDPCLRRRPCVMCSLIQGRHAMAIDLICPAAAAAARSNVAKQAPSDACQMSP
ncbi:hypothetical protein H0G86_012894 [Trichoderma simmonsii]|uniref:Uncharacterized protein n=1 Tax=Trichoderma simmonsii TaxID=1491479 RepID=A0A8G0LPE2_9HYPO|nr:hypothetical protein H0G86_012894 [Trichoderma simmonsii]